METRLVTQATITRWFLPWYFRDSFQAFDSLRCCGRVHISGELGELEDGSNPIQGSTPLSSLLGPVGHFLLRIESCEGSVFKNLWQERADSFGWLSSK